MINNDSDGSCKDVSIYALLENVRWMKFLENVRWMKFSKNIVRSLQEITHKGIDLHLCLPPAINS